MLILILWDFIPWYDCIEDGMVTFGVKFEKLGILEIENEFRKKEKR